MKLLVDAQCVQSSSSLRGIGRYALPLLRGLQETAGEEHRLEVLLNGGDDQVRLGRARTALERFLPRRSIHVFEAPWPWRHGMDVEVRRAAELSYSAAVASLAPDVLLVASVFEGDRETVLSVRGARETTAVAALLFDLIPAADPGTYLLGPGAEDYWRRFEELRAVDALLSISDYSAGHARQLLGQDAAPLTTIWGGPFPSGDFPEFEQTGGGLTCVELPQRYLLTVGGDHPRKNLDRLVQAWGRTQPQHRAAASLVIACGLNPGTVRRLRRVARRAGLADGDLLLTGRVSDAVLERLYAQAHGFVFASTEEGLGMPPIEAMAVGCPTALARSSSLVELSDEADAFFDPHDVADMARALGRLVSDEPHRERLRAAAARSRERLTWTAAGGRAWKALAAVRVRPPRARLPVDCVNLDVLLRPGVGASAVRIDAVPGSLPAWLDDQKALPVVTGAPSGLRAAMAGVGAVVVPDRSVASALLAAGVVDHSVVTDADFDACSRHDPLLALRDLLAAVPPLRADVAESLLHAVSRPPRWAVQRPRPVWLLITTAAPSELDGLHVAASDAGGDLVLVRPGGESLAMSADVVGVQSGCVDAAVLSVASSRGAAVFLLDVGEAPAWAIRASTAAGWAEVFQQWAAVGRTTGWPWRA